MVTRWSIGSVSILMGFTGFHFVNKDQPDYVMGFIGFLLVLLDATEFYWVLLGFTGFYWVLLGFSGLWWVHGWVDPWSFGWMMIIYGRCWTPCGYWLVRPPLEVAVVAGGGTVSLNPTSLSSPPNPQHVLSLPSFAGFYRVFLQFGRFTGFYRVLLGYN